MIYERLGSQILVTKYGKCVAAYAGSCYCLRLIPQRTLFYWRYAVPGNKYNLVTVPERDRAEQTHRLSVLWLDFIGSTVLQVLEDEAQSIVSWPKL